METDLPSATPPMKIAFMSMSSSQRMLDRIQSYLYGSSFRAEAMLLTPTKTSTLRKLSYDQIIAWFGFRSIIESEPLASLPARRFDRMATSMLACLTRDLHFIGRRSTFIWYIQPHLTEYRFANNASSAETQTTLSSMAILLVAAQWLSSSQHTEAVMMDFS